jgi:hypothetical protein
MAHAGAGAGGRAAAAGGGGGGDKKEKHKWLSSPKQVAAEVQQRLGWNAKTRNKFETCGIDGRMIVEESERDLDAILSKRCEWRTAADALGILKQLKMERLKVLFPEAVHLGISFTDYFAGTTVSLPRIPLLPDEQAALAQVTRPLQLMKAAAFFFARQSPAVGRQRLCQQPLPPLDCVCDGCPARLLVRVMFGCAATACRRLASAPGNALVSDRTMRCWAELAMERVLQGHVRRVQVQPQRRARCAAPYV